VADFESVANDLTALLATTLTAASVVLVGENTQPDGTPRAIDDEWAELRLLDTGQINEIGGRIAHHTGLMIVEIYTELGKGSARGRAIADAIAIAFQGIRVGAASCYEAEYRPGARDPGGAFWHSGCSIRFRWEHTPT
jgi:hypothetical protein